MEYFKFTAWFLLNVAVPLLAPIALLPLLSTSKRYPGTVKKLVRRSLQDGQLFWTVIALCAAAWYEAAGNLQRLSGNHDAVNIGIIIAWVAIAWHTLIIVFSSVLVLFGTMDAFDEELGQVRKKATQTGTPIPSIMRLSIWASAITAFSLTLTHAWTVNM
ncbi:MAG TPA: hypothetical protein VFG03_06150 [Telluria sp.]|nr:hypothetical protein [Telluria sp.]